jgi:acyl carrier protein
MIKLEQFEKVVENALKDYYSGPYTNTLTAEQAGLDSLDLVEMVMACEEKLSFDFKCSVEIPDEAIEDFSILLPISGQLPAILAKTKAY